MRETEVGVMVRALLRERGWTLETLAEVLGVHRNTVARLSSGARGLSPTMAHKLGAAFGVPSADEWMRLGTKDRLAQSVRRRW